MGPSRRSASSILSPALGSVGNRHEATGVHRPTIRKAIRSPGRFIAGVMAHETADFNEQATRLLQPAPSDWVLEIGFGHGRTIERLAKTVNRGRVCGVDVSESMLNVAIRRNRRAIDEGRMELRRGDCASLPFDDASFDGALSVHTLYFWSDPAACLRETRRVLRPGARLVLGFLPADSSRRKSFPTEIYTFHGDEAVQTMLATLTCR
jgi:ubiquinone/menaquinone biosynthesis C-methylase UbiE